MVEENPKILNKTVAAKYLDARNLKFLTQRLLQHVEGVINLCHSEKVDRLEALEKTHNFLFGKASVVNSLATLTDLLIKLDQLPDSKEMETEKDNSEVFSEYDITLIEAFVRKQKAQAQAQTKTQAKATNELSINHFLDHTELKTKTNPEAKKIKRPKKNKEDYEGTL